MVQAVTDRSELDRAFGALADPTRRAMVARLKHGETCTVSELAEPFDMSLPAVIKHLSVLEGAGLVIRAKQGRTVFCRLNPEPMGQAMAWLEDMQAFWSVRLDALAEFVEAESDQASDGSPSQPTRRSTRKVSAKRRKKD